MSENGRGEFLLDLDAFAPAAGRCLKFRDRVYVIRNFNDIPMDDALLILRAKEEMGRRPTDEQLELGMRYVAILIPEMDRAILGGLTANQMLQIMEQAMGAAEVPPVGGTAPPDSPSASPSSPASTAGPTETSGS